MIVFLFSLWSIIQFNIFTGYVTFLSTNRYRRYWRDLLLFLLSLNNKNIRSEHWNYNELNSKAVAFKLSHIHSTIECDEQWALLYWALPFYVYSSFVRLGFVFDAYIGLDARLYLYNKGHNGVFVWMHDYWWYTCMLAVVVVVLFLRYISKNAQNNNWTLNKAIVRCVRSFFLLFSPKTERTQYFWIFSIVGVFFHRWAYFHCSLSYSIVLL